MYECNCADPSCCCDKIREVMAENERLRGVLERIAIHGHNFDRTYMQWIARAALEDDDAT